MTNAKPPAPFSRKLNAMTKAELIARLTSLPCVPGFDAGNCPAERLKQELATYQVKLEEQNQDLHESRLQMEEMLARYSDLYDFAPVGYLTQDKQGYVQDINLAGAALLGLGGSEIIAKPLSRCLAPDSRRILRQHLTRVFQSAEQVIDEVRLRRVGGIQRHVRLVSMTINPSKAMPCSACRSMLVDITNLKEKEAELTLSHQQMRNLAAHLDQVREDERKRMAREIHDELGQKLAILRFDVAMLDKEPGIHAADGTPGTTALLKQIDGVIGSMRAIASDLRPAVLDLGLVAAIEWQLHEFRRRTGIACSLNNDNAEIPLDDNRSTAVFRIVQESLANIVHHAHASQVEVLIGIRAGSLIIQIDDNGVGIAENALNKSRSFGIAGMRERVRLLDGNLNISNRTGHGTTVKISIPLKERRVQDNNRNSGRSSTAGRRSA